MRNLLCSSFKLQTSPSFLKLMELFTHELTIVWAHQMNGPDHGPTRDDRTWSPLDDTGLCANTVFEWYRPLDYVPLIKMASIVLKGTSIRLIATVLYRSGAIKLCETCKLEYKIILIELNVLSFRHILFTAKVRTVKSPNLF